MPEWLTTSFSAEGVPGISELLTRLGVALLFGLGVALIYRVSHGRTSKDSSMMFATLVLLSILIAMVSMVIGNSVARAFSLVGALSIVRFRTVVDDTRDTAFVIFSVIVGMAVGTGLYIIPLVGLPVVAVASIAMSSLADPARRAAPGAPLDRSLTVRLGLGHDHDALLRPVLARHTSRADLVETATARQGAALQLTYHVSLSSAAAQTALVLDLNHVEGIQNVELSALPRSFRSAP